MPELVLCKICGKRRARRACPAVSGDICSLCCGTEREVSLACPIECQYLQEAHLHEKPLPVAESDLPNRDVEVSESFLVRQEETLLYFMYALLEAALRTPGAFDTDVITALEALIQTQRTLDSGLVYETRPENTVAASVQRRFNDSLKEYQKLREEREPMSALKNSETLALLVFLHRIGAQNQNGRPKGRMFIDLIRRMLPEAPSVQETAPSIIL